VPSFRTTVEKLLEVRKSRQNERYYSYLVADSHRFLQLSRERKTSHLVLGNSFHVFRAQRPAFCPP